MTELIEPIKFEDIEQKIPNEKTIDVVNQFHLSMERNKIEKPIL